MKIIRSLTLKLTLAFLLVGLTGAIFVAVIVRQQTRFAFDRFIVNREQQNLIDNLVQYYQAYGSWESILGYLLSIPGAPLPNINPRGGGHGNGEPFTLIDGNRMVVYSPQSEQIGQPVSSRDLSQAIPLKSGDQTIGWLIQSPGTRDWIPGTPEGNFLQNVNRATLLSALVAAVLALILGGVLAFTMTRSLRELIEATVEIARGKLGKQVQVRSKDELGELASSFNQMSLDLEKANLARRQMTADIAHDLRSPLSVIAGYVEALSEGKLLGNAGVYGILSQETNHLRRLVEDLRLLSLADAGELPLTLQKVDPRLILEQAAARHAMVAQDKDISLRLEAAHDISPVIVDVERMAQVFDNLIINAFRYTPPGGEIVLAANASHGSVQLQVRDNGSGITTEDLPCIFDRFYRGDKSRHQSGESGLGLAIVKSIIEAHGGTIVAESPPEQGAIFTVSLAERTMPH